jgi:hypothetical protein
VNDIIAVEANKIAEKKVYEEGGYTALWKYRFIRFSAQLQDGTCCG